MSTASTALGNLKNWFGALLVHNQNQSAAMQRAASATAMGLDPTTYGVPLPGSTVTTTTTNNTGSGLIKGAILAAALLVGGGAGTLGVSNLLTTKTAAPVATTPTVTTSATPGTSPAKAPITPTPTTTPPDASIIYFEQQQPDGTWKAVAPPINVQGTVK